MAVVLDLRDDYNGFLFLNLLVIFISN